MKRRRRCEHLITASAYGLTSTADTHSPPFYVPLEIERVLAPISRKHTGERAIYVATGERAHEIPRRTAMTSYEIHVCSTYNPDQIQYAVELLNDHAAMRRVDSLAAESVRVELWRNGTCIYERDMRNLRQLLAG